MSHRISDTIDWQLQQSRIGKFFRRRVANTHDADDLTQEVILEGVRKIDSFEVTEEPTSCIDDEFSRWLYGIARFKFMEYCTKHQTGKARIKELGEHGCEELHARIIPASMWVDSKEIADIFQKIVSSLSPSLREIAFYAFGGFSSFEIAERLEVDINTIHARMSRLRSKVKESLRTADLGATEMEQILISFSHETEISNEFVVRELMPWSGGGRFSWSEFVRYIRSRGTIPSEIADCLARARRQAERIEGDRSDMDYIIDQIGAIAMEVQRPIPNKILLRKYANRIRHVSAIVADILEPTCGGIVEKQST